MITFIWNDQQEVKMKIKEQLQKVLDASRKLNLAEGDTIRSVLMDLAAEAEANTDVILNENLKDLERMDSNDPKYDRLKLTKERIESIAADIRTVADLESPVGKTLKETVRPNGLKIKK
jgi:glutamate-5-semialdehyde dehydrogenase